MRGGLLWGIAPVPSTALLMSPLLTSSPLINRKIIDNKNHSIPSLLRDHPQVPGYVGLTKGVFSSGGHYIIPGLFKSGLKHEVAGNYCTSGLTHVYQN